MNTEMLKEIASEIQMFQTLEQKEAFLFVLGALTARIISLKKAAEIVELEPEVCLKLLELIGVEFSYLSQEDVLIEKNW